MKKDNRRRRHWIDPNFQTRYIRNILLLELLVAAITALLTLGGALLLMNPHIQAGPQWRHMMFGFAGLVAVLGIALIYVGVRVSHKLSGPVYHMRRVLREIREGKPPKPICLRDGDEFMDLAQDINDTVEFLNKED